MGGNTPLNPQIVISGLSIWAYKELSLDTNVRRKFPPINVKSRHGRRWQCFPLLSFLWTRHWLAQSALELVDIGREINTQLFFHRHWSVHNMSVHVILYVIFFTKQEIELYMKQISMCYNIWSVTGWLSSWTVIQWINLILNFNLLF